MRVLENKESLAARAALLNVYARGIADGFKTGSFRSLYRGQGIEFSGVREYLRGDDIRAIDWNVTARMGKTFVKLFDKESELIVFFVIDRSLSMTTGSKNRRRLDAASEAAAILSFAAEQNNYPIGAVIFTNSIEHSIAPSGGRDRTMLLLSWLDKEPRYDMAGSALGDALRGAAKLLKKRSLVFVFSDFRTTGYETELGNLASRHDVVAVRCTDKTDMELPSVGAVPFLDTETNLRMTLPTTLPSFRRSWRETGIKREERWRTICARRGVTPLNLSTTDDPVAVLNRLFRAKVSQ